MPLRRHQSIGSRPPAGYVVAIPLQRNSGLEKPPWVRGPRDAGRHLPQHRLQSPLKRSCTPATKLHEAETQISRKRAYKGQVAERRLETDAVLQGRGESARTTKGNRIPVQEETKIKIGSRVGVPSQRQERSRSETRFTEAENINHCNAVHPVRHCPHRDRRKGRRHLPRAQLSLPKIPGKNGGESGAGRDRAETGPGRLRRPSAPEVEVIEGISTRSPPVGDRLVSLQV